MHRIAARLNSRYERPAGALCRGRAIGRVWLVEVEYLQEWLATGRAAPGNASELAPGAYGEEGCLHWRQSEPDRPLYSVARPPVGDRHPGFLRRGRGSEALW